MKRAAGKMIGLLTGMSMTALISAGCGAESTEMVTVTFMNGEEELGSVETEAGKALTEASYTNVVNLSPKALIFQGYRALFFLKNF